LRVLEAALSGEMEGLAGVVVMDMAGIAIRACRLRPALLPPSSTSCQCGNSTATLSRGKSDGGVCGVSGWCARGIVGSS
jgi:hypothetical protein